MLMGNLDSYKLSRFIIYFLIVLTLIACQAKSSDTVPSVTVTPPDDAFWIDPSQDLGEISKFVLGASHGPWTELGVNNLEPARNGGITFLRWPGGNWGDQNDVQTYQIDNYIIQAHMMGAEPSIVVRLPGSSPEQAAEIVRYTNIEKKYGVKYWSIGNEPSLYKNYSIEKYNQDWRAFAIAMKAVDPTIKLYGPDIHQFRGGSTIDPREGISRELLIAFLKENGDLVDIVAVHSYPFPTCLNCGNPSIEQLRDNTPEWDNIFLNLRGIVKENTGKDLPVAMTEFNSNFTNASGSETSPDGFYNAIWLADVLGRMIRQRPEIIAYWLLKNNDSGYGLMTSFNLRPTYYIYQLYKQFGNHLLKANSPEQYVSLFAARRDDGTITAIFVNRSDQAVSSSFKLENGDALNLKNANLFDSDHNAEAITPPAFKNGGVINLPAFSVTLYLLK
jgi:Glycosyl hydrolases family 39